MKANDTLTADPIKTITATEFGPFAYMGYVEH